MLTGSATLSAIGLYLLSTATTAGQAFGFATIFGLGIAYFWPTMLGVTAERFPKGGALLLALMGSVGNASIAFVLPSMGKIVDHYVAREVRQDDALAARVLTEEGILRQEVKAELANDSEALNQVLKAESIGFSMAFRWVSLLPVILIFVFGAIALRDKAGGGYRPEELAAARSEGA
jgi:MFS family permease